MAVERTVALARIGLAVVLGVGLVLFVVRNLPEDPAPPEPTVRRTAYADGTTWSEVWFLDGERHGTTSTFWEDGRPATLDTYDRGRLDGSSRAHYVNGQIKHDGQYVLGYADGLWLRWYENGQLRSRGEYDTGLAVGPWTYWFDNGVVYMEAVCKGGVVDGPVRIHHPIGTLIGAGRMHGVLREGTWETWHYSGEREGQLEYENGRLHGPCRYWRIDGSYDTERSGVYEHGVRVARLDESADLGNPVGAVAGS
jgi:antitoxin component YwqK of YwqJK toxin-antitoxin module